MFSIRDDVFNTMEDRDLSLETAASILEVHVNSLYNFKKSGSIGFRTLLKIAQMLYGTDYHDIMRKWCLLLNTTESIKHSFEYAAIKRDLVLLKEIINLAEDDPSLLLYTKVYSAIYAYMTDEISFPELRGVLKSIKCAKDKDISLLIKIYNCYVLYYDKDFLKMVTEASDIENELRDYRGERRQFFKECYLYRLAEILMPVHLHFSNFKEVRHYAEMIIFANACSKTVSDAYFYLGMSFVLSDKGKCLLYMNRSRELMEGVDKSKMVKEADIDVYLTELYFSVKEGGEIPDVSRLTNEMALGDNSDFIMYFKFRSENTLQACYDGFSYFFKQMNCLFANMIADDLSTFGVDDIQIQALKSINFSKGEIKFEKNVISCFNFGCSSELVGA
ncbi:AimR family lysis-lysogeny pheromone receptor [Bacillus aerius]|uniref:AimR family lysis-lysogeny pheromone receptor n=1 Tax=Bacillus aerius TaxID=293388 RepID=UPI00247CCF18|nr:AimR family lysis-lysogeny pheromone receptor [Bacillus aerius]MDH6597585.1 hypothetical protein [Bacillus aerius]